jgi:hypothetical protein
VDYAGPRNEMEQSPLKEQESFYDSNVPREPTKKLGGVLWCFVVSHIIKDTEWQRFPQHVAL